METSEGLEQKGMQSDLIEEYDYYQSKEKWLHSLDNLSARREKPFQ